MKAQKNLNFQEFKIFNANTKSERHNKTRRSNIKAKYPNKNNFYLFYIVLFILIIKNISTESYIELKFNKEGSNRIISTHYTATLSYDIYINNTITNLHGKTINDYSIYDTIKIKFNQEIKNFSYMFGN